MKTFALLLTLISCVNVASAGPASYETQLLKLSKAIRGEPASLEDRNLLRSAVAQGRVDEFLKQKTQDYLKTPQFTLKLKQKVDELVRVIPQTTSLKADSYSPGSTLSSYNLFVEELISQNQSWNELLIGKNYRTQTGGSFLTDEKRFYEILKGTYVENFSFEDAFGPSQPTQTMNTYNFDKQDTRIAGILTTPRFFDRYVNTALNKNRRRAAAIFRVFMCDTMIPTVPAQDSKSQKTDYDTILPDHSNVTEGQIRKSLSGNVHGQQADCMSCHSKLDPMGQTFGLSAATAAIHPSPGALHYTGYDGRKVDIAVNGVGQLAEQIVKQPEFEKCQVSNFWRWYIGKDVPLTDAREVQLVNMFNQVGRKPKDFVAYLVTLPEFLEKPAILTEDQVLARRVVKIFKSCNSCHESTDENVWDLTDLPYSRDPRLRERKIKKLKEVMDIDGDGRKAEMPPEESLWQLSQDEFATIKKWMDHGAPDFKGTPQVTPGGPK